MFSLNDYLAGAGQGKFDALSSLYENAFICAHRVIALNLKATQSLMEGNLSEVRALLEAKDAAVRCAIAKEPAPLRYEAQRP